MDDEAKQGAAELKVEPEFMTMDEAAELLRVDRKELTEEIIAVCPAWAKPIGKQVRISRAGLLKWFEGR